MSLRTITPSRCLAFCFALLLGLGTPLALPAQTTDADAPAEVDTSLFRELDFRMVGPTRGGRVTAVEGHPAHPHTFYMGGAGGSGVWKTSDAGNTWNNLSDGEGFQSTSIGALAVAPSDTSIVYAGTGTDGIRSNVTTGRGLYKSTDAGTSWDFMGLEDTGQIGAVEVHPENPDRVYAAALGHPFGPNEQRGLFRSTDGGQTWDKVLYASDSTGAIDVALNPENPDEIYAAMWRGERKPWTIISGADAEDGLYKSTDGGDSWTKLENGLPQGLVGKIDLAVTPANPDRLYALVEAPGDQQGLYRSDDRGESWTQTSDTTGIMSRPFYFTNITAHPTNPDKVFVGNVRYWVSSDGGETFETKPVTHVDVHDLWINPETPSLRIQGNDGGATVSLDGGETWSTQHNQPTAELYQVNVDDQFPYWLYAGQQDNTTIAVPSRPPAESAPAGPQGWWRTIGGCETGPAVPQPGNPDIVFANCKGRFGQYSRTTGEEKGYWVGGEYMYGQNPAELEYRFQRVVPIEVSPHDSSVVYNASQYVHKTTDGGVTWERVSPDLTANKPEYQVTSGRPINRDVTGEEHYSTLYAVEVSPHDPDVIWAGANDGPVHVTRDGGDTWTEITPDDVPPNGRVDGIAPSPHDPGTATVAIQRRLLDDFQPYLYRTTDYGETWTLLTSGENGIPDDYPVRSVREDPNREGLLYAGTDFGFFVSFDEGQHWQPLQRSLPVTPITDIQIQEKDLVLSTMGRSFWIMDNLTPLYQIDDQVASADRHLFEPRDAYRTRHRGGERGPDWATKVSHGPEYPSSGAMIDFYVADPPTQSFTLDILQEDGTPVRRYVGVPADTTEADADDSADPQSMAVPESVAPTTIDTIRVQAGHNRFVWNLRHPGPATEPVTEDQSYGSTGLGPMVTPGTYQVRLATEGWSETQSLTVKMDPRVREDGTTLADLEEQLQHNLNMLNVIEDARGTAHRIDSTRTQLRETSDSPQATLETLDDLYRELVTAPPSDMSYPPPTLIDQLEYLYYQTLSADQKVGRDAITRLETLQERLDDIQNRWQQVQQDLDLPSTDD